MTKTFNCASCAAPLEFEGSTHQRCRYCNSTVIAPPEMFYASSSAPFGDFSSLTGKALKIAEIDQLIHQGNKIEAIRVFRETFGVGLAEAKEAVERMERGESVDISGMHVHATHRASAVDIEKVKKIGLRMGGSIFATVVVALLIIAGITIAIMYFMWTAVEEKMPVGIAANTSTLPQTSPSAKPTATPDAVEVLKIGGKGNGAGRFDDNRHVAVDGKGRIYSSDYSPHRIQVFNPDGSFLTQWNPETGSNLYDLVADREGNVYIANNKGVFKHEGESGKLVAKANVSPRGIALTWDGKLLVTTRTNILVLDASLKTLNEWKDAAEAASSTFGFEKITVDGSGVVYALDRHEHAICKFSPEGKFLNRFDTEANAPHAIAVDPQGRLFVSDTSEIFVTDANGKAVRKLKAFQAFGITFNQEGDMFVAARPYVLKQKLTF